MKLSKIAWRNIGRNRRRSLLSIAAIAVAAMTISFLTSMIEGMQEDLSRNLINFYSGEVRVRNAEYEEYSQLNPLHLSIPRYESTAEEILGIEGVEAVSPRIGFPARIYEDEDSFHALGIGYDSDYEADYQDLSLIVKEGRLPEKGENEAVLGFRLADRIGAEVGDKFTILSTTKSRGTNAITLTVVGLADFPVETLNESHFLAPLDRVRYFLRMDGGVTEILVKAEDRVDNALLADRIGERLEGEGQPGLRAVPWERIGTSYGMVQMMNISYNFMAIFFFLLGSTVIITTTMMIVYERTKEIGTVAALGMTGREIVWLFFLEALFLAIIGSGSGVAVGTGISAVLGRTGMDLGGAMEGIDLEISNILYPRVNVRAVLFTFAYSVGVASLVSFIPSRKAAKVEPVRALRVV
jgi:putative ABC transport system permease protein